MLRRIVAQPGVDIPVGGTIAVVAPAEVPDGDIDEVVAEALAQLESGEVEVVAGPVVDNVEVGGLSIAYSKLGDGDETVLLVHGFGGDKNSWLFVQEPLSEGRTVYAIDLPGHGTSTKDVGDGTVDTLAGTVLGFMDAVGVTEAHLVGHSLGGAVVTAVAANHADRVRSLTLVAPAGFGTEVDAAFIRGFGSAASRRELKPQVEKLFADPGQVNRQLVDDLLKYKRLDGVDRALATLAETLLDGDQQGIDATGWLAGVKVPVVVVWGQDDRVLPAANAAAVSDGVTVQLVAGAGHMVHMESPPAVVTAVSTAAGSG